MCLIAFAWRAHPDYPLIVAANRDEFFARPTAAADWWPGGCMVAGRDLQAGGTWMGVSRDGRFAALTNHRDPAAHRPAAPSRGALVADYLAGDRSSHAALQAIADEASRFNGFNLIAVDWQSERGAGAWIVSHPGSAAPVAIAPGIHGLSNARLDSAWPKVERVKAQMREAIGHAESGDRLIARLFALLDDRDVAPDAELPETGVPLQVERALSAAFIRMPGYGTRASTVVVVDRDGRVRFVERRFQPDADADAGADVGETRFAFDTAAR